MRLTNIVPYSIFGNVMKVSYSDTKKPRLMKSTRMLLVLFRFVFDATALVEQDLLIHEVSRSHTATHYSSAGLLWTSDQSDARTST